MTVTKTAAAHEDPAGDPARRAALISASETFLEHGMFPDRGHPESGPMDVAVAERMRELRPS